MIVLHAFWISGAGLCVWGEHADLATQAPRRSRSTATPRRARPHPFACPPEALEAALGGEVGEATSWGVVLPSTAQSPLSSPELPLDDAPAAGDPVVLAPWIVPACTLDAGVALDLLLDLDAARGARVGTGASLTYMAELATFALELTARGRILPGIEEGGRGFVATWRPVLTEEVDSDRIALLEDALPPACRAGARPGDFGWAPEGWDEAGLPSPATVVEEAIALLTDRCIRQSLAESPLLARVRAGGRSTRASERWLTGLTRDDGQVIGEWSGLKELQRELQGWLGAADPTATDSFRTCFRLSPPGDEGDLAEGEPDAWRLDFLLQAVDDPSLLIPATAIWSKRGQAFRAFGRGLHSPQELLLGDLGRALRLFPGLEPALRTAHPTGLDLDVQGAHDFLREAAPLLEQAGFGVLVPAWWTNPASRLGATLSIRSPASDSTASGLLGLEGLCAYEWRLALGEQALSLEEFRALAELKVPLVRLRGKWVELRRKDVDAALRLFASRGAAGEMTALEALRISAGSSAASAGVAVTAVEAEGWIAGLLSGDDRVEPVATPPGFRGTLRPYQERGLSWLSFLDGRGLGACLADDMGLGKTIQLLALLLAERADPERGHLPTLLVCPMSVVGNWQREAQAFAPSVRVEVHHGSERSGGEAFAESVRDADLVVTTYALVARDLDALASVAWGRVVLDEAQNIKNSSARQTQAVRSLRAPRRIALTGTPVENRLSELWSIMEFLNPGLLGSAKEFKETYATPIERFRDAETAQRLRRMTGPFILRRVKTDRSIIRDLPDKMEMKVYCNLTREQASLYQAVVDDMLRRVEESEGIERKGLILATMLKLKQVCNHPAQLLQDRSALEGRSGKLALLEEILGEAIDVGDQTLVFTQFAEMGKMLQPYLRERLGRDVLYLHGGTPRKARDEMVARFQAGDRPPIFLLSLKAGGTGLNLTAANQVVHFDRWWNPAVEDQATDRAFRIGQKRNVQVRKLVCAGTLEERIDAMIERKKDLAERVVGTGEGWITELSMADLREVVRLSADSAAE